MVMTQISVFQKPEKEPTTGKAKKKNPVVPAVVDVPLRLVKEVAMKAVLLEDGEKKCTV